MKNRIALPLLALACGLLCSCSNVASKRPVGDEAVVLDKAKWNGSWTTSDGDVMFTRVEDSAKGLIEIAGISLDDAEIKVEKHIIQVRKSGEWLWANMKSEKGETYQFARISEPNEQLIYWVPRAAPFIQVDATHHSLLKPCLNESPIRHHEPRDYQNQTTRLGDLSDSTRQIHSPEQTSCGCGAAGLV